MTGDALPPVFARCMYVNMYVVRALLVQGFLIIQFAARRACCIACNVGLGHGGLAFLRVSWAPMLCDSEAADVQPRLRLCVQSGSSSILLGYVVVLLARIRLRVRASFLQLLHPGQLLSAYLPPLRRKYPALFRYWPVSRTCSRRAGSVHVGVTPFSKLPGACSPSGDLLIRVCSGNGSGHGMLQRLGSSHRAMPTLDSVGTWHVHICRSDCEWVGRPCR